MKATFVDRNTRNFEPNSNTTVRAARKALETVGYDLSAKYCYVCRNGKKVVAEPGYILKDSDQITFDSEKYQSSPVKVTIEHAGKTHKLIINGSDVVASL